MNLQILSEQSEGICFVLSLSVLINYDILRTWENQRARRLTLCYRRVARFQQSLFIKRLERGTNLTLQTKERRALPMYVTYSDLIQIGIFICALVGLCYTIFKGKRK